MTTLTDGESAQALRQRPDESDAAWVARLREHFDAEQRERTRQFAERWADADRQP